MDTPQDGQRVAYVGDEVDGLEVGVEGKVLSAGATGSHVLISTGRRQGDVALFHNMDLVVTTKAAATYDNSLDSGGLVTTAVRCVFDRQGARGVLSSLDNEGHLASMGSLAEDAVQSLSVRVRNDPSMREVLALLEDDEGTELVSLAVTSLLMEACGSDAFV